MDFQKLISHCKQFGGLKLVWQYTKLGALWPAVRMGTRCLVTGRSFKAIYPEVLRKVEPQLEAKYAPLIRTSRIKYLEAKLEHKRSKIIWLCWLQGYENAPEMVKVCCASIRKHLPGYEIKWIDNNNWREFVQLPGYVVRKWEQGRIPAANFSDLLRLELLVRYGGTWMDSTVLCTGETSKGLPLSAYLDTDLFVFQYSKPGDEEINISNWFISACTNNEVLMVLRDMLLAYWRDYDCTVDYYIFHLFLSLVAKEFPEQIAAMPYGSSQRSIALMRHWGEPFDQEKWDRLVSRVGFHKLSYRVDRSVMEDKENYYHWILKQNKG